MKKQISIFLTFIIVLSSVAIPVGFASAVSMGEVYTELYRMDFDNMETMSELTTDLTAFNNAYGSSAKLLSKKPEENGEKLLKYAIYEKTAGSSDKYIDIKQQNGNSRAAIQITLPDGGFKADNGTYKISFDVKINTETYKPFFRIKTNHLDDPMTDSVIAAANGFYDWGPCLSAIGTINADTGLADRTGKILYGTYSTWDYTNGAESNSDLSANLEMDKKAQLEFGEWTKVEIKIDTINKKAHYYYNGVYTGSQEDNTFGENYLFSAKNIQLQSIQKYQVWNGCKLDNITISHSDSAVVNPEISVVRAKAFKEVYRLDFDKLENRDVETAGVAADASVFNTAYSGVASIGGDDTTYAWGIYPKEDSGNDKYLMLTHSDLANTHSKVVTLRLNLAEDERPSKDSGIYKLSYDMRINDGKGQKPFMQLKTYHYDPSSYTDYWAPCLTAIGPMTEEDGKDWTDTATVYGTYSAHAGYGETVSMETGAWYPSKIGNKYALSLGKWHNVEILFDTNNAKADYYYDGVYVGTQQDETFAKKYLFGDSMRLKNLQFQIFQGFQSKGFQIDNITVAKEISSSSMKADGFEGISAIDLSEDYKKLTFTPQSNIDTFTDAVIVDGSNGEKVAVKVSSTADKTALDFSNALNKDGLYTIYLFGEKASVYGRLTLGSGVAEEVIEKDANLELVSLDITDNNDGEFVKGDTVTAKAVLRNGTGSKQSANLFLALYNNDGLSDVKFKKLSSQAKVFGDSLSITIESGDVIRVSAFVWDDDICPVKKYSPVTVVWYDVVNKTTFDSACSYAEFEADIYYDDNQTKTNKITFSDGVITGTLFEIRDNKLMLGLTETEVDCLENGWYNIKSVFDYTEDGGNLIITVTCPDGAVIQRADPRFMLNTVGVKSISIMAAEDGWRNVLYDTERESEDNGANNSVVSPQYPNTDDAKFADDAVINLVTTFYEDAKTTRGFAWTADEEHTDMIIQYARDDDLWETDKIEAEAAYTSYEGKLYYKVDIDNLTPGESYIYRLGDTEDDLWSEFYTFETESENIEAFSFIAITDPQSSTWSGGFEYLAETMLAATNETDVKFVLNLGDMVNTGYYESEWNGYFKAVKGYAESLAHMSVVGNHEARGNENTSGKHFALHFNNPKNGAYSLGDLTADDVSSEHTKGVINNIAGSVYSFDYGDAHFAVLNSGSDWDKSGTLKILEKQAKWLKDDLNASDKKWKIVMVHQSCYPAKTERYNTRSALLDVIDECGVDIVLQGHDHIVTRTYPMKNDEIISKLNPNVVTKGEGTVYAILGASGPKRYDVVVNTPEYAAVLNATKSEQPTYSLFSIDNDSIDVITKQINGMVIDKFTITDN